MGKGTFKAYEEGEWGGDVVGAWGFVSFPQPSPFGKGLLSGNFNMIH